MRRLCLAVAVFVLGTHAVPASAHPAPFSYIDISLTAGDIDVTVVAHVFDLAHDLGIDSSERLLDPPVVRERTGHLTALLQPRFEIDADGRSIACRPAQDVEIVAARQSLKVRFSCTLPRTAAAPGVVAIRA